MSKKENHKEKNIEHNCQCKNEECHCDNDCKCHENDEKDATIELLNNRIKELEDSLLRNQAELLNYRKRKDEETSRILK